MNIIRTAKNGTGTGSRSAVIPNRKERKYESRRESSEVHVYGNRCCRYDSYWRYPYRCGGKPRFRSGNVMHKKNRARRINPKRVRSVEFLMNQERNIFLLKVKFLWIKKTCGPYNNYKRALQDFHYLTGGRYDVKRSVDTLT